MHSSSSTPVEGCARERHGMTLGRIGKKCLLHMYSVYSLATSERFFRKFAALQGTPHQHTLLPPKDPCAISVPSPIALCLAFVRGSVVHREACEKTLILKSVLPISCRSGTAAPRRRITGATAAISIDIDRRGQPVGHDWSGSLSCACLPRLRPGASWGGSAPCSSRDLGERANYDGCEV